MNKKRALFITFALAIIFFTAMDGASIQAGAETLVVDTVGSGVVDLDPPDETYPTGTVVTLTATPDPGWEFTGWSGDLSGSENPTTITMDADKSVIATFEEVIPSYALDVETTGSGLVELDPPDGFYLEGTVVTLTATPDPGWEFTGWSGDLSGSENPATITMDGDKSVIATFTAVVPTYTLSVETTGSGSVDLNPPDGPYTEGTEVELTATADPGWEFTGWSGDLSGSENPAAITMDADKSVTATFVQLPTYTLSVQKTGSGSVALDPPTGPYLEGTVVTLTATGDYGWEFTGWSGDLSGSENPTTITMDEDKSVTATFVQLPTYTLSVDTTGPGSVALNPPTGPYPEGTVVTLTALAEAQNAFTGWSGDLSGTDSVATLTMDADKSVAASFAEAPAAFTTDDFNVCDLDTQVWTFVNPLGDGSYQIEGAGSGNAQLVLNVPEGTSHNPWNTNPSVRMMQPALNTDFEIDVKFDSQLDSRFQMQGIMVEQDELNWLRFEFHHDGTDLRVFASATVAGTSEQRILETITAGSTLQMRVRRQGSLWTQSYSVNGEDWTTSGSFVQAISVSKVGPFAGNFGEDGAVPAHTALVDYFSNTFYPITGEDEALPQETLNITTVGEGTVDAAPSQPTYDCGQVVELTATPAPGWRFTGWSGDLSGTANPQTITMDTDRNVTASFTMIPLVFTSDDFNARTLNPMWTFVNPLSDGSYKLRGAGTGEARLLLTVPAGKAHNPWKTNNSVRVMQAAQNKNFELEVKFASKPARAFQHQGVIVEQDARTWLRFDFFHDGTNLHIYSANTVNGVSKERINKTITKGAPLYMKINRKGSLWTQSYSYNGTDWTTAGQYSRKMTVKAVGPFVANRPSAGTIPAFTAIVDYFFNTQKPIDPEDGTGATLAQASDDSRLADEDEVLNGSPSLLANSADKTVVITGGPTDPSTTAPSTEATGGDIRVPVSDDFNATELDRKVWTYVTPTSLGTCRVDGAGTGDARLVLSAPSAYSGEPGMKNRTVRALQAIDDLDFELEVKFDSQLNGELQSQGLSIEQDSQNGLRFDFRHDGTKLHINATSIADGFSRVCLSRAIAQGSSLSMRVKRQGDEWTLAYSRDGFKWITCGTFVEPLIVKAVGPFATNLGVAPADPALTALVDYFFNANEPILPEDGGMVLDE